MRQQIWDWKKEQSGTDHLTEMVIKDPTICYTSEGMAKHLISLIDFKDGDKVMEPCFGDGAFYNNLPTNTENIYCEINMGVDYLTYRGEVDITLSNPPFVPRKLFWLFHQKAMETTRREIYWLINFSSLNVLTPNRVEEMENKGWYIQNLHIVGDKRWFGRYAWVKFGRQPNKILSYHKQVF